MVPRRRQKNKIPMKQIQNILLDVTPGAAVAATDQIPDINPYLQMIIIVISGITAVIRLWKSTQKENK
jgi:hypothetical protein